MRKLKIILVLCFLFTFIACASNPKTNFNAGDFCGLIVDENNRPVKEFVLEINNQFGGGTYITDRNGQFRVPQIETGAVWIKGRKNGYTVLNEEVYFLANQNLYCWQIKSLCEVLEDVGMYVRTEQYEKAIDSISTVYECKDKNVEKELSVLKKQLKTKLKEVKKVEK